jgi:multicomponent Na+:H+ antiporter subunit D
VLAILLGQWSDRLSGVRFAELLVATVGPARREALALGAMVERVDGLLRQWPAAGVSLLVLAILFGAAMLAAR